MGELYVCYMYRCTCGNQEEVPSQVRLYKAVRVKTKVPTTEKAGMSVLDVL